MSKLVNPQISSYTKKNGREKVISNADVVLNTFKLEGDLGTPGVLDTCYEVKLEGSCENSTCMVTYKFYLGPGMSFNIIVF